MPRYVLILSMLAIASALLLALGCNDRGSGIPSAPYDTEWGLHPSADHSYDKDLALQLRNPDEMWSGSMYIPRVTMDLPHGENKKAPVLILLPPQDGNRYYFFKAGLFDLAQKMIASGEIQPMYIYCPRNAHAFGGFFYGNSMPAGRADSIIGSRMIEYLKGRYPNIYPQASKHGIGGVGMGAYGAFRAALKHPFAFASITVTDGPLDFDGPGDHTGFLDLFDEAVAEQQLLTAYNTLEPVFTDIGTLFDTTYDTTLDTIADTIIDIDTSIDTSTIVDTNFVPADTFTYKKFDSGDAYISLPLSRLFIGGSLAFSPHDTFVDWEYYYMGSYEIFQKFSIDDSSTLISDLVHREYGDPADTEFDFDFHLPFKDTAGTAYPYFQPSPVIWPLWMRNNLDSLHESAPYFKPLRDVDIWIATNPEAKWNYYDMTQSWISTLTETFGYDVDVHIYGSFTDEPLTDDAYLYDLLREMLIYHSESFEE